MDKEWVVPGHLSVGYAGDFGVGLPHYMGNLGKPSPGNSLPGLGGLLCQLMAVIITSMSSFVIANQRGVGGDSLGK